MLLTLQETREFLNLYTDDNFLAELIQVAEDSIRDSINNYDIKIQNERFRRKARMCARVIIQDLYDNRTLISADDEKLRYTIQSMLLQAQYCDFGGA